MRISQTTELAIVAALILYVSFAPGLLPIRSLLSTSLGKAIGLAAVVLVWKSVSPLIALVLAVVLISSGLREGMESGSGAPPSTTGGKPEDKPTSEPSKEKKGAAAASPPPMVTSPPTMDSSKQHFTGMTPGPVPGGVQPDTKEKFQLLAPANY